LAVVLGSLLTVMKASNPGRADKQTAIQGTPRQLLACRSLVRSRFSFPVNLREDIAERHLLYPRINSTLSGLYRNVNVCGCNRESCDDHDCIDDMRKYRNTGPFDHYHKPALVDWRSWIGVGDSWRQRKCQEFIVSGHGETEDENCTHIIKYNPVRNPPDSLRQSMAGIFGFPGCNGK